MKSKFLVFLVLGVLVLVSGFYFSSTVINAASVPTVISPSTSSLASTSVTLRANLSSLGTPASVDMRGFAYSKVSSLTLNSAQTNPPADIAYAYDTSTVSTTGTFSQPISGLTPNTTYYYFGYAANSTGPGSTATASFTTPAATGNVAPVVNAGTDKVITLPTNSVSLTGTATDTGGSITSTVWSKISGPNTFAISNPSSLTTNITGLTTAGTYGFRLTATDNGGLTSTDDVFVNVYYSLTVTWAGTGNGTVVSNPTGINCSNCSTQTAGFYDGSVVTLTATPSSGSTFAGWSGGPDCTDGSLTMNVNKNCTATFNISSTTSPTVSVTASPTTYSTTPSTNVSFSYVPTTSTGSTECRLLDYQSNPLTTTYKTSSPITYASPSTAGDYGYYVECRNTTVTSVTAKSSPITVAVAGASTGSSLSGPSSCVILTGQTSCSVDLNWVVANRPAGQDGTWISEVFLGRESQTGNSGTRTVVVPAGGKTFNLKVGTRVSPLISTDLAQFTVSTTGGDTPPPPVGSPEGSLTPESTSCQILAGQTSCSVTFNWTASGITSAKPLVYVGGFQVCDARSSSCTSGTKTISFSIPGINSVKLEIGKTISPQELTVLDTSVVEVNVEELPMTGTLTANPVSCTIPSGMSSCDTTFSWSINNTKGATSEITSAGGIKLVLNTLPVGGSYSGTKTYTFTSPASKIFYLYNNAESLVPTAEYPAGSGIVVAASCAPSTAWIGGKCATEPLTLTITPSGDGTVDSTDDGINCGTDCLETYSSPTTVTLTATPSGSSTFVGWSGSCSGISPTITIPINSSANCIATFTSSGEPLPAGSCGTCGGTSSRGASFGYNRYDGCLVGEQGPISDNANAWTWTCGSSSQCFEIKPFGGFQER